MFEYTDRTDVYVLISGVNKDGDPMVSSISGDPSDWSPILWASGTVSLQTVTGDPDMHDFQKVWDKCLYYNIFQPLKNAINIQLQFTI